MYVPKINWTPKRCPKWLLPLYRVWMGVALIMGTITSNLVLGFIFFGLMTPIALVFRLMGRDALARRDAARRRSTHWVPHPDITDKSYYERLF